MVSLKIIVTENGVERVDSCAANISEATRIAALASRIAVGVDLVSRLASGDHAAVETSVEGKQS